MLHNHLRLLISPKWPPICLYYTSEWLLFVITVNYGELVSIQTNYIVLTLSSMPGGDVYSRVT